MKIRPCEDKQRPETKLDSVRAELEKWLFDYAAKHAARIAAVDSEKKASFTENRRAKQVPIIPAAGGIVTPGVGKTELAAKLAAAVQAAGLPMLISVPTRQLAEDYLVRIDFHYSALAEKQPKHDAWKPTGKAVVYKGREAAPSIPTAELDRLDGKGRVLRMMQDATPHTCWLKTENNDRVARAGEQGHRPAQSLCRECPHGRIGVLKYVRDDARRADAKAWLKKHNADADVIAPCQFLYFGLPQQLQAGLVIAPAAAFSEALGDFEEPDPITGFTTQKTQRLHVVDEAVELGRELAITAHNATGWLERMKGASKFITGDENKRDFQEIEATFSNLVVALLQGKPINKKQIIEAHKIATRLEQMQAGTAAWEKIVYIGDSAWDMPMRALSVLRKNIDAGALRRSKDEKTLIVYDPSPIVEWAIRRGSTIFLDATMPLALRQIIEAGGGNLHQATARQNIHLTHHIGYMYPRGRVQSGKYHYHANSIMRDILKMVWRMPLATAVLVHKSVLEHCTILGVPADSENRADAIAAAFLAQTGREIGWFGKHDRGFDGWKGRHLIIVGMPLINQNSVRSLYSKARAVVGLAKLRWAEMPESQEETDILPSDPTARAFLLDFYAQSLAQGVGRARGVNHEGEALQVHFWGGLQSHEFYQALANHGVAFDAVIPNDIRGEEAKRGSLARAVEMVQAAGRAVSERSVREALTGLKERMDDKAVRAGLAAMRAAGDLPPAPRAGRPKRIAVDSNKKISLLENTAISQMHSGVSARP